MTIESKLGKFFTGAGVVGLVVAGAVYYEGTSQTPTNLTGLNYLSLIAASSSATMVGAYTWLMGRDRKQDYKTLERHVE